MSSSHSEVAEPQKALNEIASLGGKAAAANMTPKERKARAQLAADARWGASLIRATHEGKLLLGDREIPCYVLENDERVISTRGVMNAIGRRWRGRKYPGTELPVFLEAKNLKAFIEEDLTPVLSVIEFRTVSGSRAEGFLAGVLPKLCDIYLKARDAGTLTAAQKSVAVKADILMRALAHTGIIALVDEATGFEDQRPKDALAKILKAFISEELVRYARSFPLAYFRELCRLKGIDFKADMKLPQYFGHYTNDFIYSRLAPGVREELARKNPSENGRRRHKNYQFLTEDIGHPKLLQHLGSVVTLMKLSKTFEEFKEKIDVIHPVYQEFLLVDRLSDYSDDK